MTMNEIRAVEAGWKATQITNPTTYPCEMGCGRSITHDADDDACGYICLYCRESCSAYIGQQKREAKKAKGAHEQL